MKNIIKDELVALFKKHPSLHMDANSKLKLEEIKYKNGFYFG